MSIQTVDSIELGELTNHNAIDMVGKHEDGRKVHLAVDIFTAVGGYAYGAVLATEEVATDNNMLRILPELSRHIARLPLKGILETGSFIVEVMPDPPSLVKGSASDSPLVEALTENSEWVQLQVVCEELRLVDRSQNSPEE